MNELNITPKTRELVTLSDGRHQTGIVILADISGSMCGPRFQNLKRELGQLWQELGGKAELVAFNSRVTPVISPEYLPLPGGGTNLTGALIEANKWVPSITIVISDGEPNDMAGALMAAEQMLGEIDVIFVGSPGDETAMQFMADLARVGGGTMRHKDMGNGALILEDMREILGLPAPKAL
jgi:Mg-chelatase subunit ChlD